MPYADRVVRLANSAKNTARYRAEGRTWPADLVAGAKRRARMQGTECTIDTQWVRQRLALGCSISLIPFDLSKGGGRWVKRPFIPSIDRIMAGGPYTPENCRLVCLIVNEAMNAWGLEPLRKLAKALHHV